MASRSGSYDAKDPLSLPVQYLKGVGPARAKSLARLGISTVRDLLEHFPRRYEDRSHFKAISQLVHGELETLCGVVTGVQETRPRRGLVITRVGVTDGMTVAWGVWFNQPYLARHFPPGTRVILSGRVERRFGQAQITNPEYEVIGGSLPSGDSTTQVGGSAGLDETIHTGRVVPIYPLTEGLQPRAMRAIMKNVVDQYAGLVPDPLPFGVRSRHGLAEGRRAWAGVHFPSSLEALEEARRRLVFDELFVLQLGLAMIKSTYTTEAEGIPHRADGPLLETFLRGLPFTLTQAQQRAYGQIRADMESPRPMNRLIQGDVGSGKTVVAAMALLKAVESGYQGALMAPTEILAVQHYLNLSRLLAPLDVRVELVTGSLAMIKSTYTTEAEGIPHRADGPLLEAFLRRLPFTPTQAQQRAYGQIRAGMESPRP
ncbi:MAG: DEAD/DEAH box helicase, partial [Actinobacteria bacterium]|nr:DEAD/DEAH box helicase [Actinomycetota bacterium]